MGREFFPCGSESEFSIFRRQGSRCYGQAPELFAFYCADEIAVACFTADKDAGEVVPDRYPDLRLYVFPIAVFSCPGEPPYRFYFRRVLEQLQCLSVIRLLGGEVKRQFAVDGDERIVFMYEYVQRSMPECGTVRFEFCGKILSA